MKKSKYQNVKAESDSIIFASKKERDRYNILKLLERAGEITDLKIQPVFVLQPTFKKNGQTIKSIKYIADFQYYDIINDVTVVEDVKGYDKKSGKFLTTSASDIKRKLFEYKYPELSIRLV